MWTVVRSEVFDDWLAKLRDQRAVQAIEVRLRRFRRGIEGDVKPVGKGVEEVRLHIGPGYRLYFSRRSGLVVIMLCGGDKSSQGRDIKRAQQLSEEFEL